MIDVVNHSSKESYVHLTSEVCVYIPLSPLEFYVCVLYDSMISPH